MALVASLAAVAPAGAAAGKAKGAIIIEGLTLAGTQFGTPSMQPTTVATDPVSIPVTEGDTFTYSTITCATGFPPWNTTPIPSAYAYVTSAVSSSINPAGATTIPLGSGPSCASAPTVSPAASHSTPPAAMSQTCTPRS